MTIQIADAFEPQFGDLGDAIVDELKTRLGYMKDRDAKYLQAFVQLLDDSGIAEQLATKGSDSTKSLIGRTRGRRSQLNAYAGKGPAPGWLYSQTVADVVASVEAAQSAGIDTKTYLNATMSLVSASVGSEQSPAPTATLSPTGAPKTSAKGRTAMTTAAPTMVQTPAPEAPYYAAHATDLYLPESEKPSSFWKTVKEYALPIGIVGVGAVAAVVIALLERKRKPAAAVQGLAGLRGGCGGLKKRWLRAEKRAHASHSGRVRRKAEGASTRAYKRAARAGCPWAR